MDDMTFGELFGTDRFIRLIPWIMANPLSKRLPNGFRARRNGFTSIEVFCIEWQAHCATWPGAVSEADCIAMEPVFELLDRLFPDA